MLKFCSVILLACNLFSSWKSEKNNEDYSRYVNPFVGAAEYGHCSPGACVPFGLVQAGPQTGNCEWKYCSGYQSEDLTIYGFSQNRLNGTGCTDLGDILIFPFSGEIDPTHFWSKFDKKNEFASPGYYSVLLNDDKVKTEISASAHTAIYRFTYPGDQKPHLLIDFQNAMVGDSLQLRSHVTESNVNFENTSKISGYTKTRVWVDRTYYYTIEFNKPFTSKTELAKQHEEEQAPRYVFDFDLKPGEELLVKVALSSESSKGARKNLVAEIPEWNFDMVKETARENWNKYLSRVQIDGTDEQKNIFYTSMYHLLIQPNNLADAGAEPFYSTFSLWDTYRAAHPLYTILCPDHVDGFVNSMLKQHDQQGFLPIWALWGKETFCMIGNHAVPVIADAYLKGFRGFDAEKAYQAVRKSLTENHPNSDWNVYNEFGYYPFDRVSVESVSRTMESAYDDYCAAQFAKALNKEGDYQYFFNRSVFYKNLFDPQTKLMRGKDTKGNWRTPFKTFDLSHAGSSGGDYTEGNAWQYTWHVQHDVAGLMQLMGGADYFTNKLDSLFEMASTQEGKGFVMDVTGLIGQYAHGNEPSHHIAYLYALAGKPWKTQKLINEICRTKYLDQINGLCGNDDCGQMSAWYIFSSLGFYPVNPCGGEYVLGAPQVPKAIVALPGGKTFTVEAINYSSENIYVQSIELNGKPYEKRTIQHNDIVAGGSIKFNMGDRPKK